MTDAASSPSAPARRSWRWLFATLRVAFLVFAAWLVWYIAGNYNRWTGAARLEATEDAYIAGDVTPLSATDDFLASQVVQALGQSLALTAVVALAVQAINPADALTIGALLQMSRLFGGEIGTAFMQTFVRMREQTHSYLIGLHVDGLSVITADRLALYRGALASHGADLAAVSARATNLLIAAVAKQAAVLSYIDGFLAAAAGAYACLLLVALLPGKRA